MSADAFAPRAIRGLLRAALLAVCCSLAARAATAQFVPASGSGDLLQFLDGSVLHGSFRGMDGADGILWNHPEATNTVGFRPSHLDFVRLNEARSVAMSPTCHIRFASGDDLFGSLVSLDSQTAEFTTWFGGTMRIPRAALQTITFLPKDYSIVYQGPTDSPDWVVSTGQLQFRGGRGGRIVIGGVVMDNTASGNAYWTYHDGSFVSGGGGTLGRDFSLTGSATIEFDLAASQGFSMLMDIYSSSLERVDLNSGSFLLELDSGSVALRQMRRFAAPTDLGSVMLSNLSQHITIHCNKEQNAISVLADGVEVKRWTDVTGFDRLGGGGVMFQNQSLLGTLKISNIKISQWKGGYEPDITPLPATNADLVSFINHDKAPGAIDGVVDGKLSVKLEGRALNIPVARVRQIDFAKSTAAAEPRGPWEVRAVFPGGGSVSFELDKWDSKVVSGRSALFGPVAFQPGSIREMEFNLDRPTNAPAPVPLNDFEALDQ